MESNDHLQLACPDNTAPMIGKAGRQPGKKVIKNELYSSTGLVLKQAIEDVFALNNYSYQTAVHVFQKKEFAFENVIGTVGKILVGVGI